MKILLTTLSVFFEKSILIVLCLCTFCSCGDDSDGGEAQGAKGGNGRKIVKMAVTVIREKGWPKEAYQSIIVYTIKYDGDGRLIEIYRNDNETSKNVIEIDYNLMLIKAYGIYIPFSTNQDGFVTQFPNYQFTYNEGGYLKNIAKPNNIWSFAYENNYLTSFHDVFFNGSRTDKFLYNCYYENDNNTEETHFYINLPFNYYSDYQDICIILYQAGFFGRITRHFKNNTNSKTYNASLELNDNDKERLLDYHYLNFNGRDICCFKYSFVYE